jgi:c-di-GMP-binding flagellar brake protein YcgR
MPHRHATDVPPANAEDSAFERYELREPAAVQGLLRRLIEHKCTVSVTPVVEPRRPEPAGVVSALLAVDEVHLWVDVPRQEALLRSLLRHPSLAFDGYLDRVHVRFRCGPAVLDSQEGQPALRVPTPDRVLHLQRRELMRREPPPGELRCMLPARPTAVPPTPAIEAAIRDIGGGGLALLVPVSAGRLKIGEVLRGCRIAVPETGVLEVDLETCHVREFQQGVATIQQAGCRFVDMAEAAETKLFRYLMHLDRERMARR